MILTFHLDFDPHQADHRRAADWLAAQPDPTEAVARLIGIANEGEKRLLQWEELATLLASEVRELRAQLAGQPPEAEFQSEEVHEDPESAQRLDSMFG
jgi:hypothetical protein